MKRYQLILLLGALSAFAPLSTDMYLPALPDTARDLGTSTWAIQLTLTTSLIGLGAGQLVAGPMSDALGRRRPLLWGLTAFTIASGLCALCPNVWVLVALRLVQGASGAAGIVIARAVVRDRFAGAEAANMFARLVIVMGLAPILAPLMGAELLHVTNWRGIFVILAVIGAALLAVSWRCLEETLAPEARRRGGLPATMQVLARLRRDRHFMGYALSYGLSFGAVFAYISASPFIIQDIFSRSPEFFSMIFAVNAAGLVAASQLGGWIVGRTGPKPLLILGLGAGALSGVALIVISLVGAELLPILACFLGLMVAHGLVGPNASALAMDRHPSVAGSASALIGLSQFTIGAAVAPLVGARGTSTIVPMAIVMGVFAVAAACVGWLVSTRGEMPLRPVVIAGPMDTEGVAR